MKSNNTSDALATATPVRSAAVNSSQAFATHTLAAPRDATYSHLFSVPFMQHVWKDTEAFNAQLQACILAQAAKDHGVQATNAGGWHSAFGQLEFLGALREPLIERMQLMVNSATDRLLTEAGAEPLSLSWSFHAWANVCGPGAYHVHHTHPGMTWSGVYYVDTGEAPGQNDAGTLRLIDPIPASSASFLPRIVPVYKEIQPVPGLMIVFPSYLPHSVHPHGGSRKRISIAFNFRNEPYP